MKSVSVRTLAKNSHLDSRSFSRAMEGEVDPGRGKAGSGFPGQALINRSPGWQQPPSPSQESRRGWDEAGEVTAESPRRYDQYSVLLYEGVKGPAGELLAGPQTGEPGAVGGTEQSRVEDGRPRASGLGGPEGICTACGQLCGALLTGQLLTQCLDNSSWQLSSWAKARAHCGGLGPQSSSFWGLLR